MKSRRALSILLPSLLALAAGWFGRALLSEPAGGPAPEAASKAEGTCPGGAAPLYWKAPMDPTYVRSGPGKSPMGMDLIPECPSANGAAAVRGQIRFDASTIQSIGVRTAVVERRELARTIRAVGRVATDERRVTHAHTKVQGWVEELFVEYVGQEVKKGERLLEIYSPELVATQEELLLAARYREATRESPFDDVRGGGTSLFDATRRRLELWDVPQRVVDRLLETRQVQRTLTLHAHSAGVVTQLGVRVGMEVKPNDNLYTIADLSEVWILANVYEFELPWIALGQEGSVELSYLPGKTFSGPVTYISPFLDPKTRTAEVRLELPNPDGRLKPEMFANVVIRAAQTEATLAVPSEAVIRSGRRTLVILALGEGRFEPRQVKLGIDPGDGWVEIEEGLAEGEEVVVSSQFLIDSESRLREAVNKLLAPEARQARDAAVEH